MRQILGAFAEYEKSLIVAKLRGARQRTKAKKAAAKAENHSAITKVRVQF
jgi:hypothetical protein